VIDYNLSNVSMMNDSLPVKSTSTLSVSGGSTEKHSQDDSLVGNKHTQSDSLSATAISSPSSGSFIISGSGVGVYDGSSASWTTLKSGIDLGTSDTGYVLFMINAELTAGDSYTSYFRLYDGSNYYPSSSGISVTNNSSETQDVPLVIFINDNMKNKDVSLQFYGTLGHWSYSYVVMGKHNHDIVLSGSVDGAVDGGTSGDNLTINGSVDGAIAEGFTGSGDELSLRGSYIETSEIENKTYVKGDND